MIKVEHLRKTYENTEPLKDINVVLNEGDVVSIIGPSGTGKSTFLRCLNLLEKPTSGHIWIDGTDITQKNVSLCTIRKKIGFVFQSFNLYEHLTAVENVMFAQIKLLGRNRQEAYDHSMHLLETVGLAGAAMQYGSSLSGGQKQRVAIARTLAMDPDIILFDEPTSALDPLMVGEVSDVIYDLADRKKTMLIVTHEMEFAKKISDRILFFSDGIVYEDGTPEEIFEHPQKEKTQIFMQSIGLRIIEISHASDYYSIMTDVKKFVLNYELEPAYTNKLQLIVEEIMVSYFKIYALSGDKMKVVLKYDKYSGEVICSFFHNIEKGFLSNGDNEMSAALITNLSKTFAERESDDDCFRRVITCVL